MAKSMPLCIYKAITRCSNSCLEFKLVPELIDVSSNHSLVSKITAIL